MLIRIYPENPNPREMVKALKMLRDGELIIYPTDTVYAIGCDALNVRAVERICALKGVNPQKSNLSIICYDLSNISEYAQVSNAAFKLLKKNLPGPFTFILPTSSRLPKIYKNKKEWVSVCRTIVLRVDWWRDWGIHSSRCRCMMRTRLSNTLPILS